MDDLVERIGKCRALLEEAISFGNSGQAEEAVARFDLIIAELGDPGEPTLRQQSALAHYYKGIVLKNAGDPRADDALNAFQHRFGNPPEPAFFEVVSRHLLAVALDWLNAGETEKGLAVLDDLLRQCSESTEGSVQYRIATALYNKGTAFRFAQKTDEAVEAFNLGIDRFGDTTMSAIRTLLMRCLFNKGIALRDAGSREQAITAFEDAAQRMLFASETEIRERVASSLWEESRLLAELDPKLALPKLEQLALAFKDAPEANIRITVAKALHSNGELLLKVGRREEALASFDELIKVFQTDSAYELQECVLKALCNRGNVLRDSGRLAEALQSYDDALTRLGPDPPQSLRTIAGSACMNLGVALTLSHRTDDALAAFDRVFELLPGPEGAASRDVVARALFNKGTVLNSQTRVDEAVRCFDALTSRFENDSTTAIRELVASGFVNKGVALLAAGRATEAIRTFDEVISRFANAPEASLQKLVTISESNKKSAVLAKDNSARAGKQKTLSELFSEGVDLETRGELHQALSAFDELISVYDAEADDLVSGFVTASWAGRGRTLAKLGRPAEAIAAFDQAFAHLKEDPSDFARNAAADAMTEKANVIRDSGDPSQALTIFDHALTLLGHHPVPLARSTMANIFLNKGATLVGMKSPHQAIVAFDQAIRLTLRPEDENTRTISAKALFNKAVVFLNEQFPVEAKAACEELARRFGDAGEPEIRELILKGKIISENPHSGFDVVANDTSAILVRDYIDHQRAKGEGHRIRSIFEIVPDSFRDLAPDRPKKRGSDDGAVRHVESDPFELDLTAFLKARYRLALIQPAVVPSLGLLFYSVGLLRPPRSLLARCLLGVAAVVCGAHWIRKLREARLVRSYLDMHLAQITHQADEEAHLHREAARILLECREQSRPFALLLRNFDLEAYQHTGPALLRKKAIRERIRFNMSNQGNVEIRLASALRGCLPILGIANPSVHRSDYRHAVPKVSLPFDRWQEVLHGLVQDASLIVMDLDRLSPGVSFELRTILQHNKQQRTVIVLSDPSRQPETDANVQNLYTLRGIDTERLEPLDLSGPELSQFPRVIRESEVPFADLYGSLLFSDLLPPRSSDW